MSRWYAYLVSAIVIVAVAWPVLWKRGRDSFPLSPYPMFSRPLPTARVTVTYALGIDPDGSRHLIEPSYIANDEVLLAKVVLRRETSTPRRRHKLCRQIAGRIAKVSSGSLGEVSLIRIVRGTHDAVDYLTGRNTVGKERELVRCPVKR